LQALLGLGRSAVKTAWLGALGAAAVAANLLGVDELTVLLGAGIWAAVARAISDRRPPASESLVLVPMLSTAGIAGAAGAGGVQLSTLFLVFLKVGSVLFGSGYVLLAFLRSDLVERLHWLTEGQLLDAIAVGQVTPGPVFTTATF